MAVTEVLHAAGSWDLTITEDVPQETWAALDYFGHVVILPGRLDPRGGGDALLDSARYVGPLRRKKIEDGRTLAGAGMSVWLGDEEGKGPVIETLLSITSETFEDAIRLVIPPASSAILEGNYFALPSNPLFTGTFQWVTQREALNYLANTLGGDWKISGSGFLQAGPEGSLFVTDPKTVVVPRGGGLDMKLRAYLGRLATERDVEDYTTRTVLLADNGSGGVATGSADIAPGLNPYNDIHGNDVRIVRLISETATDVTNAAARAQLQLNRFTSTRKAVSLSTGEFDVNGDLAVGDYLWVYDPDNDLVDVANELLFRGERMYPLKLRLNEMTWPITRHMTVAFRTGAGQWLDLTNYVVWEDGDTALVVGGFNKELSDGSSSGGGIPTPPQPNTTVPDAPTWVTPFVQGIYQSALNGESKAQTTLTWQVPTNTDGSAVTDADYYEIRYRSSTTPLFPVTHAQLAVFTHAQLGVAGTFGSPLAYPVGDWQYARVPATELSTIVYELSPVMPYEAQIRLVDNGTPANAGDWSTLTAWQTADDTLPPSTPAAPEIAAGYLNAQVVHRLGKASGGTFNLERDIHHFEVHGQFEPLEPLSDSTRLGRVTANAGMIIGQIPVVGRVPINTTAPLYYRVIAVDNAGNKSQASPYAVSTALLVDDAHISNLTVDKVIAGTIQSAWIVGGSIATAPSGQRVLMTFEGLKGFDASNALRLHWDATANGVLKVLGDAGIQVTGGGNVEITDGALIVKNASDIKIVEVGECADGRHGMQIYTDTGVRTARLGELAAGGHGIEVIDEVTGDLVKVSTLAFGMKADSVSGQSSRPVGGLAFGDLTGSFGPQVTVTIGPSGRAVVIVGCRTKCDNGGNATMAFRVSGNSTRASSITEGVADSDNNPTGFSTSSAASRAILVTGLTSGSNTFTAEYATGASSPTTDALWSERHIIVIPY